MDAEPQQLADLPQYVTYITAGLFLLCLYFLGLLMFTNPGKNLNINDDEEI